MLRKGHAFLALCTLLLFTSYPLSSHAQTGSGASLKALSAEADYDTYPRYQFQFRHLDWKLSINPATASGEGIARYRVDPYPFAGDTLILQTLKTEIQDVRINNTSVDYLFEGDSLLIPIERNASDVNEIALIYTFGSETGIYQLENGTIFTSMLPGEVAHILPGVIHPRTRVTADIEVKVPSDYDVVMPGTAEISKDTGEEIIHRFSWSTAQSITNVNFAVGKFESQDTYLGVKKLYLNYPQDQFTEEESAAILRKFYSVIKKSEQIAQREYPFESLQIVVLPDAMWETRQSSAGFGYLFLNRPVDEQVALIVAQQWLGAFVQPETWEAAGQLTYPISLLYSRLLDKNMLSELEQNEPEADHLLYEWAYLYHVQEMATKLNVAQNQDWRTIFNQSITDLISQGGDVITLQRIQDSYYQQAGRLVSEFELPEEPIAPKDSITVDLSAHLSDGERELTLGIQPADSLSGDVNGKVEFTFKGRETNETISLGDTLTITNAMMIDNVFADWKSDDSTLVVFNFKKPFRFWVDDLRNGTISEKIRAAHAIAKDISAADRELLLSEQLKRSDNPSVRAALLIALAEISGGAMGTEERYLTAVRSDEEVVKRAAIISFRKYEGNDQMIYELKRIVNSSDYPSLIRPALESLYMIDEKSDYDNFIQRKLRNNANINAFYFAVPQIYAQQGDTASAVSFATQLDDARYNFPVRAKMVSHLLSLVKSDEQLRKYAEEWVNDPDPRLRYVAFKQLRKSNKALFFELSKERVSEESDLRVLQIISKSNQREIVQ